MNHPSYERAGELLESLHKYAAEGPHHAAVQAKVDEPGQTIDNVLFNIRLDTGGTLLEEFVHDSDGLTDADRTMVLAWRENIVGLYEIRDISADGVRLFNHIDEMTYQVRTNIRAEVRDQLPIGRVALCRLGPFAGEWIFLKNADFVSGESAAARLAQVPRLQRENPKLVFRNPHLLARGWELQAAMRGDFIAYHGSDTVMVHGSGAHDAWTAPFRRKILDSGRAWSPDAFPPLAPEMAGSEDVTLIFDEVDGLSFYVNYGRVRAAFVDPALVGEPSYRNTVLDYLYNDTVPPVPLARLATAAPDRATRLFARLMHSPDFSWERDGDDLLRRAKARWYAQPRLPRVVPLTDSNRTDQVWPRNT
ncbi:hypothetical protein [Nocardia carnea]|uniref:hypothetical protein n=1 Tax=Nocardia carnea TaxID=37328 RepID=UPI002455284B|nr:hypothetical protein [Nocardia carnea]